MKDSIRSVNNFFSAKDYLDSFVNYEKVSNFSYRKNLKLQRVIFLLSSLNIKYNKIKAIHIAGTKGKGSTATFCAYLLANAGLRVGLYTSPHFFDFRERIQILTGYRVQGTEYRGKIKTCLISKKDVVMLVQEMQPQLEKLRVSKTFGDLSFFEVYTALAFKYFLEQKIDIAVLETGLGGRLDATNVITPAVSIITHIGYDHMEKLGSTLSMIASEKAGIIKNGIDAVFASQVSSVLRALESKSRKMKSRFFVFGRDFKADKIRVDSKDTNFDFHFGKNNVTDVRISLKGRYQVENASLALAAVFLLKEKGIINRGITFNRDLRDVYIGGRFEILASNPLIICDVAHNPSSFLAMAQALKIYYPSKKIIFIFAASQDKDVRNMLKEIKYEKIILTSFNNPRAFNPEEIKKTCGIKQAYFADNVIEALTVAKKMYNSNSLILISGSLFLVSEAKELLQKNRQNNI